MAERLVDRFGADIPRRIAASIAAVHPSFPARAFIRTCLEGYDALDLMARGRKIAAALRLHLPAEFPEAAEILVRSMGAPLTATASNGMAPFFYMPHAFFVAESGLGHFEAAMRAQYEITQRFTAEFSIRPFIDRYPLETLERLREWARDPNVHVRRLVSEGTRPRLPWAPRLRAFQRDPRPVLEILELLKDDPELYVRRSVANNLNDIGKDHPALLVETARRWFDGADSNRRWIVAHSLRSALKRGERGALDVLGFGAAPKVEVRYPSVNPPRPRIGGSVGVSFEVVNTRLRSQRVLVDLRLHFVKASGKTSPKTFKMKPLELAAGEVASLSKTISLAQLTTRKHYPGTHRVEAVCNGRAFPVGAFELRGARGVAARR